MNRLIVPSLALFFLVPLRADTFTVGPGGTHSTIQAAIDAAVGLGGENAVQIQQGIYNELVRVPASMNSGTLAISGGWNAGFSEQMADPALTVISGEMTRRGLEILNQAGRVEVENLTVKECAFNVQAAGVLIQPAFGEVTSAQIRLIDVVITENEMDAGAFSWAAGLHVELGEGDSRVDLRACQIHNNTGKTAATPGAGFFVRGMSTVVLEDSFIRENSLVATSRSWGGGLVVDAADGAQVFLDDSEFSRNSITGADLKVENVDLFGAGFFAQLTGNAALVVTSCDFSENIVNAGLSTGSGGPAQITLNDESLLSFGGNFLTRNETPGANSSGLQVLIRDDSRAQIDSNSMLEDWNDTSSGQGGGIVRVFSGSSATSTFEGNHFRRNRATAPTTINGFEFSLVGSRGLVFGGNTFRDTSLEPAVDVQSEAVRISASDDFSLSARSNLVWGSTGPPGSSQVNVSAFDNAQVILSDWLIAAGNARGLSVSAAGGSRVQATNLTLADHSEMGFRAVGDGTTTLYNSILSGNGQDLFAPNTMLSHNLIDSDPLFVNRFGLDYRLLPGSPAIDAGSNDPPGGLGEFDLDSDDRIFGSTVDIGAYELNEAEELYVFAQAADGVAGNIGFNMGFNVANLGANPMGFTLDFLDDNGQNMELPVQGLAGSETGPAGAQLTGSVTMRLDSGHSVTLETTGVEELKSGYAVLITGEGIGANAVFTRRDVATGTILLEAGVPATMTLQQATVFANSLGNLETGLAVVDGNVGGDAPAGEGLDQIPVRLYDESFNLVDETILEMSGGQHLARFVTQFFPDSEQAAEMRGVVTVESDVPLALVTLRQNDAPGVEYPGEVPTLAAFPVMEGRADMEAAGAAEEVVFYFAQVGAGVAGDIGIEMSLNLANRGMAQAAVLVEFFDDDGNPMELTLGNLGTDSSFQFNLAAGESKVLATGAAGDLKVGYARVTTVAAVAGTAVFSRTHVPTGTLVYESGVPVSTPSEGLGVFVDTSGNRDTGVALVNTAEAAMAGDGPLTLRLYNQLAVLQGEVELELGPGEHVARFVTQLFAEVEGVDEMQGLMTIEGAPLAAVTLRQNDDPAAAFPEDVPTLTAYPVLVP